MTLDVLPAIKIPTISTESAQLLKLSAFAFFLVCSGLGVMVLS